MDPNATLIAQRKIVARLLGSDPERSREYVQTAGREAMRALENLRQTVGLLRTDGVADLAPAPSLADIPALVTVVMTNAVIAYRLQQIAEDMVLVGEAYEAGNNALRLAVRTAAGI